VDDLRWDETDPRAFTNYSVTKYICRRNNDAKKAKLPIKMSFKCPLPSTLKYEFLLKKAIKVLNKHFILSKSDLMDLSTKDVHDMFNREVDHTDEVGDWVEANLSYRALHCSTCDGEGTKLCGKSECPKKLTGWSWFSPHPCPEGSCKKTCPTCLGDKDLIGWIDAQIVVKPKDHGHCVNPECNRSRSHSRPHLCRGLHKWIDDNKVTVRYMPLDSRYPLLLHKEAVFDTDKEKVRVNDPDIEDYINAKSNELYNTARRAVAAKHAKQDSD